MLYSGTYAVTPPWHPFLIYAHALSYSTGTSWVLTDTNLPITISNMSRTRWGKNWGQYDRMDWVHDVDINDVCHNLCPRCERFILTMFSFVAVLCVSFACCVSVCCF